MIFDDWFAASATARMKISRYLILGAIGVVLLAVAPFTAAQNANDSEESGVQSGQGGAPPAPPVAGQGGSGDTTLEIAPQPGAMAPKPGVEEIPGGRAFRPGEDTATVNRRFEPGTESSAISRSHRRPYLGITVRYTTKCYLGGEEHGLEVLNVDPNSPAAVAGVHPSSGMTALGAAGKTAGQFLGPLNNLVMPLLEKGGELGREGDLIVAIDDQRVRSTDDLENELAKLKPGDTMYLTVIRPLPGGGHKTMKIAVRLGELGEGVAKAAPGGTGPSAGDSGMH